jgi:phosphomethylpyrimidine synthase
MCGPKFCSMQLTHQLRAQALAGMKGKSEEFVAEGAQIYVPLKADA